MGADRSISESLDTCNVGAAALTSPLPSLSLREDSAGTEWLPVTNTVSRINTTSGLVLVLLQCRRMRVLEASETSQKRQAGVPKPPGDAVGWIHTSRKTTAEVVKTSPTVKVASFVDSSKRHGKKHQREWKSISNPHTSL